MLCGCVVVVVVGWVCMESEWSWLEQSLEWMRRGNVLDECGKGSRDC